MADSRDDKPENPENHESSDSIEVGKILPALKLIQFGIWNRVDNIFRDLPNKSIHKEEFQSFLLDGINEGNCSFHNALSNYADYLIPDFPIGYVRQSDVDFLIKLYQLAISKGQFILITDNSIPEVYKKMSFRELLAEVFRHRQSLYVKSELISALYDCLNRTQIEK